MRHNNFLFEEKKLNMGSFLWNATKFLTKATWCTTKFMAKNAPAAIGMAWSVRKEVSNIIGEAIHEARQEQKRLALENKILEHQVPKK